MLKADNETGNKSLVFYSTSLQRLSTFVYGFDGGKVLVFSGVVFPFSLHFVMTVTFVILNLLHCPPICPFICQFKSNKIHSIQS